jgi:hypothetical protein
VSTVDEIDTTTDTITVGHERFSPQNPIGPETSALKEGDRVRIFYAPGIRA